MTEWSDIRPGDVVEGRRDGKAWTVTEKTGSDTFTLECGNRRVTMPLSGSVVLIASAGEMLAAAEAAVKLGIPGSAEIAVMDKEERIWKCPPGFAHAGTLQAHAYVLHGKRLAESPLPEMLNEHNRWHHVSDVEKPHLHLARWREPTTESTPGR